MGELRRYFRVCGGGGGGGGGLATFGKSPFFGGLATFRESLHSELYGSPTAIFGKG